MSSWPGTRNLLLNCSLVYPSCCNMRDPSQTSPLSRYEDFSRSTRKVCTDTSLHLLLSPIPPTWFPLWPWTSSCRTRSSTRTLRLFSSTFHSRSTPPLESTLATVLVTLPPTRPVARAIVDHHQTTTVVMFSRTPRMTTRRRAPKPRSQALLLARRHSQVRTEVSCSSSPASTREDKWRALDPALSTPIRCARAARL